MLGLDLEKFFENAERRGGIRVSLFWKARADCRSRRAAFIMKGQKDS